MRSEDEELWGWVPHVDSESVDGPFASREEAVAHGRTSDEGPGWVARCARILPEEWVGTARCSDLDALLEEMEESLENEAWAAFDDPTFEVKEGKVAEAQAALAEALQEWAEEWLHANGRFVVRGDYEKP